MSTEEINAMHSDVWSASPESDEDKARLVDEVQHPLAAWGYFLLQGRIPSCARGKLERARGLWHGRQ